MAFLALHPDASTHHFAKTLTNGETKTRPSIATSCRCFNLTEGSEKAIHPILRNADAGILDAELQFVPCCVKLPACNRDRHLTLRCELQSVAEEIRQDLSEAGNIADKSRGRLIADENSKTPIVSPPRVIGNPAIAAPLAALNA